ncbi:MAG: sugar phosphate nucleotidyltransferase [Chlamydiota bacterium]
MSNSDKIQLNKKIASIVLAGGLGTRLHPLTLHRCKPAVCFAGRYRLIDIPISNSLNSQIFQIFVISQYFASNLQKHLSLAYPHGALQKGHLEMLCPEETPQGPNWFLGTADAVRKNIDHINSSNLEYFLILSGDQLYNIDLIKMVEFASERDADLVIAALPVEVKDATRMGLLKISSNHQIVDFIEKPKDPAVLEKFSFCQITREMKSCYLGSMGIYVFKKEALLSLLQKEGNDFGKDLIPIQIKQGKSYAFVYDGYWEDIGTIDSYYQANLALINQEKCLDIDDLDRPIYTAVHQLPSPKIVDAKIESSILSQGCVIEAKEIIHSVIGLRTHIGKGTVIKDSVIMGNHEDGPLEEACLKIGENCIIEKAIIDEQCKIGNGVTLVNTKSLLHYDGDGVFIREGIIIVASGTKIPDGFIL